MITHLRTLYPQSEMPRFKNIQSHYTYFKTKLYFNDFCYYISILVPILSEQTELELYQVTPILILNITFLEYPKILIIDSHDNYQWLKNQPNSIEDINYSAEVKPENGPHCLIDSLVLLQAPLRRESCNI